MTFEFGGGYFVTFLLPLFFLSSCNHANTKHERIFLDSHFISADAKPVQAIEWKVLVKKVEPDRPDRFTPEHLTSDNHEFKFDSDDSMLRVIGFNNQFYSTSTEDVTFSGDSLSIRGTSEDGNYSVFFKRKDNVVTKLKVKDNGEVVNTTELIYNHELDTLLSVRNYNGEGALVGKEEMEYVDGRRSAHLEQYEVNGDTLRGKRVFDKHNNFQQAALYKKGIPYLIIYRINYYRDEDKIVLDHNGVGAVPFY